MSDIADKSLGKTNLALGYCQASVSAILLQALGGTNKALRTEDGHVKWGLVEDLILGTIEDHWPKIAS